MIHGRGDQYKLTKDYDTTRNKGMLDKTKLSDTELVDCDITFPEGEGATDPDKTYVFYNIPQTPDPKASKKKKVDRRTVGWYGLGK